MTVLDTASTSPPSVSAYDILLRHSNLCFCVCLITKNPKQNPSQPKIWEEAKTGMAKYDSSKALLRSPLPWSWKLGKIQSTLKQMLCLWQRFLTDIYRSTLLCTGLSLCFLFETTSNVPAIVPNCTFRSTAPIPQHRSVCNTHTTLENPTEVILFPSIFLIPGTLFWFSVSIKHPPAVRWFSPF